MEELDEVSRRALLIKAREALEKDYRQAEADKKALDAQIEAKRKELRDLIERVEAAKIQAADELKRVARETVRERESIQAQNEALKIEFSQRQASRNREETLYRQALDEHELKITERRAMLHTVSQRVLMEEARLKACQESLAEIKQTLAEADL